jgi:5-(carboxyamino)imidazole ribonucleotide mutase
MPPGIPVATVGLDAAQNAAILAIQILSLSNENIQKKFIEYKNKLGEKVVKANAELSKYSFKYKTN